MEIEIVNVRLMFIAITLMVILFAYAVGVEILEQQKEAIEKCGSNCTLLLTKHTEGK